VGNYEQHLKSQNESSIVLRVERGRCGEDVRKRGDCCFGFARRHVEKLHEKNHRYKPKKCHEAVHADFLRIIDMERRNGEE